jgi:lipid-binding SYLF domain-containing protein
MLLAPATPAQSKFDGLKDKAAAAAARAGEVAGDTARRAGELGAKAVDHVKTTAAETAEDLGDADTPAATRAKLDLMAAQTLERLLAERPDVAPLVSASHGYAVFDTRQVKLGIAGGYGRGVAVGNDTGARTYMRMGSAGVGVDIGIGGFDTQFVILFETPFAYRKFITQGLDATAEAGRMLGDEHERLALGFEDGRAVFVLTKQGWKLSAGLTGTRYWPDEKLNTPHP